MRTELDSAGGTRVFSNAVITVVVLVLIYAAFDDITTDDATTFRVEYTCLIVSAGWLLFFASSLIRGGHRTLGVASLVALAGALWAQRAIGPRMPAGLRPEHIVLIAAYLWFWVLAGATLWRAWRARQARERQAAQF